MSYLVIMGETIFSYLTALLRLYHLPFINSINGETGSGRYDFIVESDFIIYFMLFLNSSIFGVSVSESLPSHLFFGSHPGL